MLQVLSSCHIWYCSCHCQAAVVMLHWCCGYCCHAMHGVIGAVITLHRYCGCHHHTVHGVTGAVVESHRHCSCHYHTMHDVVGTIIVAQLVLQLPSLHCTWYCGCCHQAAKEKVSRKKKPPYTISKHSNAMHASVRGMAIWCMWL